MEEVTGAVGSFPGWREGEGAGRLRPLEKMREGRRKHMEEKEREGEKMTCLLEREMVRKVKRLIGEKYEPWSFNANFAEDKRASFCNYSLKAEEAMNAEILKTMGRRKKTEEKKRLHRPQLQKMDSSYSYSP